MRDRGSVWSLDQHQQQQQQQPGICLDLQTYYGIVSYAVGVSLILTISGIKSGRRFFLHRRHSGRRSAGHVLGYDRANHHPPREQQEQEPLDQQELVDLAGGLDLAHRYLTEDLELNPETRQESGQGLYFFNILICFPLAFYF
jgi:hypothetical protein